MDGSRAWARSGWEFCCLATRRKRHNFGLTRELQAEVVTEQSWGFFFTTRNSQLHPDAAMVGFQMVKEVRSRSSAGHYEKNVIGLTCSSPSRRRRT